MTDRRPKLRQYVLYLNRDFDQRLITHLDRLLVSKRANNEMRRLLYAGLDCDSVQSTRQPAIKTTFDTSTVNEVSTDVPAQPMDVRQKAKRAFG